VYILANHSTKNIRNLSLISHGGAGKTSLTEITLLNAEKIKEAGSIDNGNTKSDFNPEEKEHKYSIINSFFSFPYKDKEVNLVDTPGYIDFRGEVTSALEMVESTVLLIDATAGIQVNTKYVWELAEKKDIFRFIFINKLDKEGANFLKLYEEINEKFEENIVPLTIPCGEGENYTGIIDLLSGKSISYKDGKEKKEDIPQNCSDSFEEYKFELIESVVELDDELMMKYLEDEEIKDEELINALLKGVKEKKIVPLMTGSAINNSGIDTFWDYLLKLIPSPDQVGTISGFNSDGEEIEIEADEEGPFVAKVGKTMVDPYIGKLSIFRVLSGKLNKDVEIYVPRSDSTFSTNKFYKLNGSEQENVDELIAGEIGAVAKVEELETSDTLNDGDIDIKLDEIEFPEPMLILSATPLSEGDDEKMTTALNRYSLEDPTFKVNYNKETKQLILRGMGSVHLDVIKDTCKRKFDVEFKTETPKVAYKETIQKKVEVEEKYKKQSGGRGQYGHVLIRMEPLPRGKGFEFEEEIFGGSIPNQYIPAVEKGLNEAKDEGVLAKYPVVDFRATVYDGSYHNVDSSEMAFKIASSKAFRKGMKGSKPVLLEPIMDIEVTVPENFMGDIMGDLNSRRGKIQGMDPRDGKQIIKAKVPEVEMFSYATDLKSITGGYGSFNMNFSHYDKVPSNICEEIIEEAAEEEE